MTNATEVGTATVKTRIGSQCYRKISKVFQKHIDSFYSYWGPEKMKVNQYSFDDNLLLYNIRTYIPCHAIPNHCITLHHITSHYRHIIYIYYHYHYQEGLHFASFASRIPSLPSENASTPPYENRLTMVF